MRGASGKKSLGRDFAVLESVDGDSVSRASLPFAERIGERSHGSVEMLSVEAEGETEEIGLLGVTAEAIVGEIADGIGFEIQDGERLFLAGSVGAVAAVEKNGEAAVG